MSGGVSIKNNKLFVGLGLTIVILLGIAFFDIIGVGGYRVSIVNQTSKNLKNLEITYSDGRVIEDIEMLSANKTWRGKVDTSKAKGEDALLLEYEDASGERHSEYIDGYIEKGYSGNTTIVINSIDENGKIIVN